MAEELTPEKLELAKDLGKSCVEGGVAGASIIALTGGLTGVISGNWKVGAGLGCLVGVGTNLATRGVVKGVESIFSDGATGQLSSPKTPSNDCKNSVGVRPECR